MEPWLTVRVVASRQIELGDRRRFAADRRDSIAGMSPEFGENTITPSSFQVPPLPSSASQIVCTGPPVAGTLRSLPLATKPIHRLSGDQKG